MTMIVRSQCAIFVKNWSGKDLICTMNWQPGPKKVTLSYICSMKCQNGAKRGKLNCEANLVRKEQIVLDF